MSHNFRAKTDKSLAKRGAFNFRAKHKQKVSKDASCQDLKSCYLGFLNFWVFDPQKSKKIQKSVFAWTNVYKIQNFQFFQKTGIYVREPPVGSQNAKFQVNSSIFDPQMALIWVPCGDVIFVFLKILAFIDFLRKN